ncbi:MAG: 4Fe-4S dicluster domain-containing protein [Deltaproteobacteria bacterium]|nr:MAG: 4Fe-4S dicluster domain-containing protein [Deltaproteobacteria bacterium]
MFFTNSLYVALTIFGLGLLYKISIWFRYNIGVEAGDIPTSTRISAAIKGITLTLFSGKIFTLLRVFIVDVLLQIRVLRQDFLRWLMHICLYVGFMLLLLMHGLDKFITSVLFPEYYSTINPFMFLRDLFGFLVIVGIGIALYRRFVMKIPRLRTGGQDYYALIILAIIMISGVLLEGTKITSYSRYQEMVEEYTIAADEEELRALETYWVKEFAVVSPTVKAPFDDELLESGKEAHEMSCAQCHSKPQSAFLGYTTAKIISPIALGLDRANIPEILWYIHFLACWLGLAYLPFSKMFHLFASPLSLLANSVMDMESSSPANIATRQVLELDACTHCGSCTLNCSVGVAFESIPNLNILPSEKIGSLKKLASGSRLTEQQLIDVQEGIYLCTNCERCTVVCPVGINLQDMWFSAREAVLGRGYPEFFMLSPFSYYRGLRREALVDDGYREPLDRARGAIAAEYHLMSPDKLIPLSPADRAFRGGLSLSAQASTFSVCFGCQSCTTVCPVVANYDNPEEVLGMLPHQIMHACGLGVRDLALGSNMLWDCLTCYQCQEHCPQGVTITDVLYELKNVAVKQVRQQST